MILRRPAPPEWPERHHRVCFLGTVRYAAPLDPSRARQWERLADLGAMFIVGFSGRWGARRFTEHGRFYLLPTPPAAVLRYLVMAIGGTAITAWLVARRGVDLVVAQSPYEGCAAAVAIRLAGWLGHQAGLIVESHGDFEEAVFLQRRVGFPRLQRALMRAAARFAVRRADALRAVSSSTEIQLVRLAPATPIVRFPTWTDLDVFVRAGDRGDSRSAVILYAGRLTPLKGVDRLLDAFERVGREIPDARLWITGQAADRGYARALADRARRSTLAARIEFTAWVPQAALADRMARARVLVLPSRTEGLPRVVLEAMAAGTAVVVSAVGGVPDLVEHGATGFLVSPGDVEGLTSRLLWVLRHPDEVDAVRRRARDFARGFFSADAHVAAYARLFRSIDGDRSCR